MKQLAWEKDIDLNKGGAAPPAPIPATSTKPPTPADQPRGSQVPVSVEGRPPGPGRGWARTPSPAFRSNKVGAAELEPGSLDDAAGVSQSTPAGKRKKRRKLRRRAKQTARVGSEEGGTRPTEGVSGTAGEERLAGLASSSVTSLQSDASSRTSLIPRRET